MDSTDKLYHSSFSVAGHFIYVHQLQIPIHKVFSRKFGEHQVYTGTVVDPLYVTLLVDSYIFTGRNEVVAKVMFLHVCVILFMGGGLWAGPPGPGRESPPRTWQGEPPQDLAGRTPPDQAGRNPLPPQDLAGRTPPDQAGRNPLPPRDLAGRTPPQTWQGGTPQTRQGEPPPGTWQGEPPRDLAGRTPPPHLRDW